MGVLIVFLCDDETDESFCVGEVAVGAKGGQQTGKLS